MKDCLRYFIAFIIFQVVFSKICTPLTELLGFTDESEVTTMRILLASGTSSIATIAMFAWRRWWKVSLKYIKSCPYEAITLTVVLAFATLIPSAWLSELLPEEMTKDLMQDVFEKILSRPEGFIFIALLAPTVEEIVFRGAILRRLLEWSEEKTMGNERVKTKGAWLAIVISAMLFSAIHGNPAQMPHAFLIGLLLGWLFYRTGSIVLCVILHFINNSTAFLVSYLLPEIPYDAKSIVLFNNNYTAYYSVLAVSIVVAVLCIWRLGKCLPHHQTD